MKKVKKDKVKLTKKQIIKRVLIICAILFAVFIFINILPFLMFCVIVLWNALFDVPGKPKVKHGEFPFELVYTYKGEEKVIKDAIVCDYEGYSFALDSGNTNDYDCDFKENSEYGTYYIDKENLPDLYIAVPTAADYYMGEKDALSESSHPFIRYSDESTGMYYEETEKIDVVDVEIIDFRPSEPLKNNFK